MWVKERVNKFEIHLQIPHGQSAVVVEAWKSPVVALLLNRLSVKRPT